METENKYLIIGRGSIASRHEKNLRELEPNAKIVSLSSRECINKTSTLTSYFTQSEPRPKAVFICSPATTHAFFANIAIEAGIPAFIEKPLADSTSSAESIEKNQSLMVGYNLRFSKSLLFFRELIQQKKYGLPLFVRAEVGQHLADWRTNDYKESVSGQKSLGGGVLLELSHEIDYISWIFGMPTKVYANLSHRSDLEIDVEDCADLIFQIGNLPVSVHLDFIQKSATRFCKVCYQSGNLVWDYIDNKISFISEQGKKEVLYSSTEDKNIIYIDELKHFLDCVNKKTVPSINFHDGLRVLKIIEALKESSKIGGAVKP